MLKLKFSQKIIVLTLLSVVLGFGVYAYLNDSYQKKTAEENLEKYIREIGSSTASEISGWIGERARLVELASQLLKTPLDDQEIARVISARSYEKNFSLSYFGYSNSSVFVRYPHVEMPNGYDFRTRPVYLSTVAAGRLILTEPYVDAATGGLVASILTPLIRDDALEGVLGVDLSLQSIVDLIVSKNVGSMGYAFLVNEKGVVIVSPVKEQQGKPVSDIFEGSNGVPGNGLHSVQVGDKSRLLYFKEVNGMPGAKWYVGLSIDKAAAYAQLSESRKTTGLALVAVLVLLAVALAVTLRVLLSPLHTITDAMRDIADGDADLTKRIEYKSADEFGQLSSSFNSFVSRIGESIGLVSQAADELNIYSRQVLVGSKSALVSSEEQAERVLVIASSVEELGATAQEIARTAALAASETSSVSRMSDQGARLSQDSVKIIQQLSIKVLESSGAIERLSSRTNQIGAVLDVIKGISEQTNLLALNAAIEAARAGEAGRGFAVVADEVRNLAHRAQVSALEINEMIVELQSEAQRAVEQMDESRAQGEESLIMILETGKSISELTRGVGEIDKMNLSVATATEEQTSVVHSLNSEIVGVSEYNREFVEGLNKNIHACAGLGEQAVVLKRLVDTFKI